MLGHGSETSQQNNTGVTKPCYLGQPQRVDALLTVGVGEMLHDFTAVTQGYCCEGTLVTEHLRRWTCQWAYCDLAHSIC